jgi:methyltransferase (TIGR00027 family)
MGVAVIRTVHQLLDDKPLLLEDPISRLLIGDEGVREILDKAEKHSTTTARGLRSHVALRSRYTEDELCLASQSGIGQFVNLGAGYDTFAFRQPDWALGLRIVEMDHPATQSAKRDAIEKIGIQTPQNVALIPLDLEKDTCSLAVAAPFLDPSLPTFVACLGVLAYLRPETVDGVFHSVAKMPKGSRLLFAFAPIETNSPSCAASRAAAQGEPWFTRLDVDELKDKLVISGFRVATFLDPVQANERYYKGRHDLPAPRKTRLCQAVV